MASMPALKKFDENQMAEKIKQHHAKS